MLSLLSMLLACTTTAAAPAPGQLSPSQDAHFSIELAMQLTPPAGAVDVWLPLPTTDPWQQVEYRAQSSVLRTDLLTVGGNTIWHAHLPAHDGSQITVLVSAEVLRLAAPPQPPAPSAQERLDLLRPTALVPTSGALVEALRAELALQGDLAHQRELGESAQARAIFDYVLQNMEYKKTGSGWGNGSTEWACSAKYGNCTDFHALFASLARAQGLPTRFEIGFPVDTAASQGSAQGYHCWLQVWTQDRGWLGIDASAAAKDPTHPERYFGQLPPDRVRLSAGRELVFGQASGPLNFMVYPHVEVDGEQWTELQTQVTYQRL